MENPVRSYRLERDWLKDWENSGSDRGRTNRSAFREIASFVAGGLHSKGFQMFENGGTPLYVRYFHDLREELLLVPAPQMAIRKSLPFTANIYLSSPEMGRIRSRFWRPACRAPHVIASGNIGRLEVHPVSYIFEGAGGMDCASRVTRIIERNVLPWLEIFHMPDRLRSKIYEDELPLVNESTAVELLLAQFDPYEARRYLRYRELNLKSGTAIHEVEGYDLQSSRINPIRTYYKLGSP